MQIAIGLYPGFTALDAIGPYQVFSNLPGGDVVLCAERTGRLADDNDVLHLVVEHSFADVPTPDVLLVPGGMITRRIARERGPIVEWIAEDRRTLYHAALAHEGLDATTHWCAYDELSRYGARPTERRVVFQGKVVTAAGVSAGIDLGLAVAAALGGPEVAQAIQLGIEYDPQPPFDSGSPSKAPAAIRDLVASIMTAAEQKVLSERGAVPH